MSAIKDGPVIDFQAGRDRFRILRRSIPGFPTMGVVTLWRQDADEFGGRFWNKIRNASESACSLGTDYQLLELLYEAVYEAYAPKKGSAA